MRVQLRHIRFAGLMGLISLLPLPAAAAFLELRTTHQEVGSPVRLPVGHTAQMDVWLDSEGESIRTLNLYLRYDPEILQPLDARPGVTGLIPFQRGVFMPDPDEVFNSAILDRGELVYAVTNSGNAGGRGRGVVASVVFQCVGPTGPEVVNAATVEIDFRYPLHYTSYEIIDEQGRLQKRDFMPGQTRDLTMVIDEGLQVEELPQVIGPAGSTDHTIALDDYVHDNRYTDDRIEWTVSGASRLEVEVDASRYVRLSFPSDWSGSEILTFVARSPDGLEDQAEMAITVVGPPRLASGLFGLPDLILQEDLVGDELVLDPFLEPDTLNPAGEMIWRVLSQGDIQAAIHPDTHSLSLIPPTDWYGEERIRLEVSNRFGLTSEGDIVVVVMPVNDAPTIGVIDPVVLRVDTEIDVGLLSSLVQDIDDPFDQLQLEVVGDGAITTEIRDSHVLISGLREGVGTLHLGVVDPKGARAEKSIPVQVLPPPQPPLIAGLPDVLLIGQEAFVLPLDPFVFDADTPDSLLSWTVEPSGSVGIEIDNNRRAVFLAMGEDSLSTMITFLVVDPEGFGVVDSLQVTVLHVATPEPELLPLPELRLTAGGEGLRLQLADYLVYEGQADQLRWHVSDDGAIVAVLDPVSGTVDLRARTDAVGLVSLEVVVEDPSGNRVADLIHISVETPDVLPPLFTGPAQVGLVAGDSLAVALGDMVEDPDTPTVALVWEVVGDDGIGEIRPLDGLLIIRTTREDSGRIVPMILRVVDTAGNSATGEMTVFVVGNVGGLVTSPVPVFDFGTGDSIAVWLDEFIYDIDGSREEIVWSVDSAPPEIEVRLDTLTRVAHMTRGWVSAKRATVAQLDTATTGTGRVVLVATDPAGNTARLEVPVSWSELPDFVVDLPDTVMVQDSQLILSLADFVTGPEPQGLTWTVGTSGQGLIAVLDTTSDRLVLTAGSDFIGIAEILAQAHLENGPTRVDTMRVRVHARPPILQLKKIDDVHLVAGDTLLVVLNELVLAGVPEGVHWEAVSSNALEVLIDPTLGHAVVRTADHAAGEQMILFTAVDLQGHSASEVMLLVVVPRLRLAPGMADTLDENIPLKLDLDDTVLSGSPGSVFWTYTAGSGLEVDIDPDRRKAVVSLIGGEARRDSVKFEAATSDGQTGTFVLSFLVRRHFLAIRRLPDFEMAAGATDSSLVLDAYVESPAPGEVEWHVDGQERLKASVDATTRRVRVIAPELMTGVEWLVFTATHQDLSRRDSVRVMVRPAGPSLQLADVPDITWEAERQDSVIVLDALVLAGAVAEIHWEAIAESPFVVLVDTSSRKLSIRLTGVLAPARLVLSALLDGTVAIDTVRLMPRSPVFELADLPELIVGAGTIDSSLVLDPFLVGADPDDVHWSISGGAGSEAHIDAADRTAIIDARTATSGRQVFLVEVSQGDLRRQALLRVDILPRFVLLPLPEVVAIGGRKQSVLDLDDFIDGDVLPEMVKWQAETTAIVEITIDSLSHVMNLYPDPQFVGAAEVILTAEVPGLYFRSTVLPLEVVPAPPGPILELPVQRVSLPVGEEVTLSLDLLVKDPDTADEFIRWEVVGHSLVEVELRHDERELVIIADVLAGETARVQLRASDPDGNEMLGTVLGTIWQRDVDPPQLSLQTFGEAVVGEQIVIRVRSDEPLIGSPDLQVNGLLIEMVVSGSEYAAFYPIADGNALVVEVSAVDLEGNTSHASTRIPVTVPDLQAPSLQLEFLPDESSTAGLIFGIVSDEILAGLPIVQVAGERLSVEQRDDGYAAVLPQSTDGIAQVEVHGADLAGNIGTDSLWLTVVEMRAQGTTGYSSDGWFQVNVPSLAAAPGRILVVSSPESQSYQVNLVGGDAEESTFDITISIGKERPNEDLALFQSFDRGESWRELLTFVAPSRERMHATVRGGGRFKLGRATANTLTVSSALAYPNPFNGQAAISYDVPIAGPTTVEIFDLQGHRIQTLVRNRKAAGPWTTLWFATDEAGEPVASGVYFFLVKTLTQSHSGKLTLIR